MVLNGNTLTVNETVARTYAGVISGSGGLIKQGAAALTLSGANTYSGTTTISAGTLQVGAGGTTGTLGTGQVIDNAALSFNRSDALTVANVISGTWDAYQGGCGHLDAVGRQHLHRYHDDQCRNIAGRRRRHDGNAGNGAGHRQCRAQLQPQRCPDGGQRHQRDRDADQGGCGHFDAVGHQYLRRGHDG